MASPSDFACWSPRLDAGASADALTCWSPRLAAGASADARSCPPLSCPAARDRVDRELLGDAIEAGHDRRRVGDAAGLPAGVEVPPFQLAGQEHLLAGQHLGGPHL